MAGPALQPPAQLPAQSSAQSSAQPPASAQLSSNSTTPFIKSLVYRTPKAYTLISDRALYRSGSGRHLAPPNERQAARHVAQSIARHKAQSAAQYAAAKYSPHLLFQPLSQLPDQASVQPPAKHPAQARAPVQYSARHIAKAVSGSIQKIPPILSPCHKWVYEDLLSEYQIHIIALQPEATQYVVAPLLQFSISENPPYVRHLSMQLVQHFSNFFEAHARMNVLNYCEITIRWNKIPIDRYERWERFLYSCGLAKSNKYFKILVAIVMYPLMTGEKKETCNKAILDALMVTKDDPPLNIGSYEFSLWFTLLYVMKAGDTRIKNAVVHYFKCKYATHWKKWQEDRPNREHRERIVKSPEGNYFRSSFEEKNNWRLLAEFDANVPACTPKSLDYENFYEVSRDEEVKRWEQKLAHYEKHKGPVRDFDEV